MKIGKATIMLGNKIGKSIGTIITAFSTNQVLYDYERVFFGDLDCDCDEKTREKLAGIIISHIITQEQVEVLWALSKDTEVVEMAARELDQGLTFPNHELVDLVEWVRKCKFRVAFLNDIGFNIKNAVKSVSFSAKEAAAAMRALGKSGLRAATQGRIMAKQFEEALKSVSKITVHTSTSTGNEIHHGLQLANGEFVMFDEWNDHEVWKELIYDNSIDIPTKSKQNNGSAWVRKKHVFKAPDNTGLRSVFSESHRRGHVHQRRCRGNQGQDSRNHRRRR